MVRKIISGGQTGVDQAALDAAIACGIDYGGWLPAGRKTESGPLPDKYNMDVLVSASYPERTRKNVIEADATLIISHGPLRGGSALTARIASDSNLPFYHYDITVKQRENGLEEFHTWLQDVKPGILNVAGPRASSDNLIYQKAFEIIVEIFKMNNKIDPAGLQAIAE